MKNILLIAKREFLTQVKKKSFILLTLLAPLLIVGFGALIAFMFKANEADYKFNVVDKSGLFQNRIEKTADMEFTFVPVSAENALRNSLGEMEAYDGLLVIPQIENQNYDQLQEKTKLYINKNIGFETQQKISQKISSVLKEEKIKKLGITADQLKNLDQNFQLQTENVVDKNKQDDTVAFGVKSGLSMILMYATFMFIIIYGVRIMRSVLEEKNNRVVEIIISSVKPFELMAGKIMGVTFVALTQFLIWITMTVLAAVFFTGSYAAVNSPMQTTAEAQMPDMDLSKILGDVSQSLLDLNYGLIIFVFLIFFLLGYIFYSSMYAAIGSAVDNETETQQFTLFAILPLTLGMYGSLTIMNNPDGPMAFWLSIIPFTSPVTMIARIPFGVPGWQIALSIALLLVSTVLMVWLASKIYKVGILLYGNKATMKELWKWIRN